MLEDLVIGEQHPGDSAPAASALYPVPLDIGARAVEIADVRQVRLAVSGGTFADDVDVGLGAEAANHQDRDAVLGKPAREQLAEGVFRCRNVKRSLTLGAIEAEPVDRL